MVALESIDDDLYYLNRNNEAIEVSDGGVNNGGEEEKKEQEDDYGWAMGGLDGLEESFDNISVTSDLVDSLPSQLHPAVSLGMKRVSSAYFSLQGSCSEADLYSLSSDYLGGKGTATQVDANWLYHDIIMHVFTFLDAKSLAGFSETARRSNFECFYFLQLQLQRALLEDTVQSDFRSTTTISTNAQQNNHQGDRLAAIAGSWSISRLASLDKDEANACVQEYLDSNSTLRTMPLSHSLAYIRQVLRRHGFPSHPNKAPALAKAAMLVTLVGAATVMTGNVEVADSFGTELPNMLFKVGFVGSLMSAARRKWEETHPTPERHNAQESSTTGTTDNGDGSEAEATVVVPEQPHSMRETAEHMARTMQEFPAQLLTAAASSLAHDEGHSGTNAPGSAATAPDAAQEASISRRMYEAFRLAASGRAPAAVVGSTMDDDLDETINSNSSPQLPQPFTPNPYEHFHLPSQPSSGSAETHAGLPSDGDFCEFKTENPSADETNLAETGDARIPRKMPSGCVGAYFRAIRRATNSITRIVKEQRRARFEAQPEKEDLTRSFIDACCSDESLHIVKDVVQICGIIDAEGFYCGSDGTETCALHAAAFHGATQVLEFLCGGIDERDPSLDQGLCCIDLQDQNGWTALHFAAGANSVESARILADRGANLSVTAENGYTPLQWAQRLSNHEVAEELKKRLEQSDPYYNANHPWIAGASQPLSMIAHRFFAMIPAR